MSIHPEFNPADEQEAVAKLRAAIAHMFPLAAVRIVSGDEIAIEDTAGRDWGLTINAPEEDEDDAPPWHEPPLDTPSLDTSFHDHEMDVD